MCVDICINPFCLVLEPVQVPLLSWLLPMCTAILCLSVSTFYCHDPPFIFLDLERANALISSNLNEEVLLLRQYWSNTVRFKQNVFVHLYHKLNKHVQEIQKQHAYLLIEHHVKPGSICTLSAFSFWLEPSVGVSSKLKWWFTSMNVVLSCD